MDVVVSALMLVHDARLCDLAFSFSFFLFLSRQADATHERVVKREDGERLAKVNQRDVTPYMSIKFSTNLLILVKSGHRT